MHRNTSALEKPLRGGKDEDDEKEEEGEGQVLEEEEEEQDEIIVDEETDEIIVEEKESLARKDTLTDMEVQIYLNCFLCAFASTSYEYVFQAYLSNKHVPSNWALYDKYSYTKNITAKYVGDEIDLFYSKGTTNNRTWPAYLIRLYYALYDSVRLCHYDTIMDMQKNQWALTWSIMRKQRFFDNYEVAGKNFNDERIINPLKAALPGLLAQHILEWIAKLDGMRQLNAAEDAIYPNTTDANDIDPYKLFEPSIKFSKWWEEVNDVYQRQQNKNTDDNEYFFERMVSIYNAEYCNSNFKKWDFSLRTYLSDYYICLETFNPDGVINFSEDDNVSIMVHSSNNYALPKYCIYVMILSGIDPAENPTLRELMPIAMKYWCKRDDDFDEYHEFLTSMPRERVNSPPKIINVKESNGLKLILKTGLS